MANNKAFKVKNGLELEAYSKAISDTAVDVFVYDTSKDSDGGAWRKRTQHTSWYNETLNTATRGSRKEFPAVAVIVVQDSEDGAVVIYDGDDPDMPLWMKFNSGNMLPPNTSPPTSVSALNGDIMVGFGNDGTTRGCGVIKFVSDTAYWWRSTTATFSGNYIGGGIINRNSSGSYDGSQPTRIVDNTINDVAMTVLPNAPIDAATGLPVPTIAVATDGGVSVIKDDGTVVDLTDSAGGQSTKVMFTQDGKLAYAHDGATSIRIDSIPSSDFVYGSNKVARGSSEEFYVNSSLISSGWSGETPKILSGNFAHKGLIVKSDNTLGLAQTGANGLTRLDRSLGESGRARNMVQYTTSSYNTGWMNGDIKLATLSDTDATNVTGSELVTNGTFDTDISGWSVNAGATVAHEATSPANSIRVNATDPSGTPNGVAYQSFPTEIGKTYTATATGTKGSGNYGMGVGTNSTNLSYGWDGYQSASNVTQSYTFVATATTAYVSLLVDSTDGTQYAFFDNISVRLAEEDRSVNGNGLQVFGTVTKSAVSSGADLVGYSGFSSSNYLSQPYNSDLDLGTADFCVMIWVKRGAPPSYAGIISYGNGDNTTNKGWLVRVSTSYRVEFRSDAAGGGSLIAATEDALTATWTHVCFVRSGGTLSLYQNGSFLNSTAGYTADLEAGTSATLDIGTNQANDSLNVTTNAFVGSLALARVSATAPSPEQIKKIYEDEKVLFQEGAQATLYGSSDAVTALAHDDSNGILSVGTSAGRSDFQGLRRVNNTTNAVGAAISASNGLIVEE